MRRTEIPARLNAQLEASWSALSAAQKKLCAQAVLEISDFFQDQGGPKTPWTNPHALMAYLHYFFPLNLARARAVLEISAPHFQTQVDEVIDLGAGFGNIMFLKDDFSPMKQATVTLVEQHLPSAQHGLQLAEGLHSSRDIRVKDRLNFSSIKANSLGFFSYSWLEMKTSLADLSHLDHLLIIEPSTQTSARNLMSLRRDLLTKGFSALAPCTHQMDCPLLVQSQRDWCHDRVHFTKPDWFLELEALLPMKNDTLTYSYLLMSKTQPPNALGLTRVIGDTLREKGKSRQAICFDDQRRFLSWLKRDFPEPPHLDHGSLVRITDPKILGQEVRPTKDIESL